MRGRGAGADSCFPRTRSPLPRCRRGVGLPGGPASPFLPPDATPRPPFAPFSRSVLGRPLRGRPGSATRRCVPEAAAPQPGTMMPRLGGDGVATAPSLVPAAAAVLLGALCLPGAPASSLLTGKGAKGARSPPASATHLRVTSPEGRGGPGGRGCHRVVRGR